MRNKRGWIRLYVFNAVCKGFCSPAEIVRLHNYSYDLRPTNKYSVLAALRALEKEGSIVKLGPGSYKPNPIFE